MNSDETQTPEQEPGKKLTVEAFEEQQSELEAEALEELEPLTPTDELPAQLADSQPRLDLLISSDAGLSDRAWKLTNLEEQTKNLNQRSL
jgi:hypothetical protein